MRTFTNWRNVGAWVSLVSVATAELNTDTSSFTSLIMENWGGGIFLGCRFGGIGYFSNVGKRSRHHHVRREGDPQYPFRCRARYGVHLDAGRSRSRRRRQPPQSGAGRCLRRSSTRSDIGGRRTRCRLCHQHRSRLSIVLAVLLPQQAATRIRGRDADGQRVRHCPPSPASKPGMCPRPAFITKALQEYCAEAHIEAGTLAHKDASRQVMDLYECGFTDARDWSKRSAPSIAQAIGWPEPSGVAAAPHYSLVM